MKRQFRSWLFALGLCLLTPFAAHAILVSFTNEALYTAAAGPQQLFIDFNGNPVGGAIVAGNSFNAGVAFSSTEASDPTKVLWNSDAMSDAGSTIAPNSVSPIGGAFSIASFGFGFILLSAEANATVNVFDTSDVLLGSITPVNNGFFGVLSSDQIGRFEILGGLFDQEGNRDRLFIDDFRSNRPGAGNPVVPEPATLGLIGVGSAMLGFLRRKRKI